MSHVRGPPGNYPPISECTIFDRKSNFAQIGCFCLFVCLFVCLLACLLACLFVCLYFCFVLFCFVFWFFFVLFLFVFCCCCCVLFSFLFCFVLFFFFSIIWSTYTQVMIWTTPSLMKTHWYRYTKFREKAPHWKAGTLYVYHVNVRTPLCLWFKLVTSSCSSVLRQRSIRHLFVCVCVWGGVGGCVCVSNAKKRSI